MPGFISRGFKNEVAIIIDAFVPDHPEAELEGLLVFFVFSLLHQLIHMCYLAIPLTKE
jgi:hypothetical protein